MTEEMEKELTDAIDSSVATIAAAQEPIAFKPKGRPVTLTDQVQMIERYSHELDARLRREAIETHSTAQRKIGEAHAHFDRQLSEETARLERERDEMVRQATEDYHTKMSELQALIRRRG